MTNNSSFKVSKNDMEHLKFISETNRTLHNQRVRTELQVVIASVTLYVACLGFKLARPGPWRGRVRRPPTTGPDGLRQSLAR